MNKEQASAVKLMYQAVSAALFAAGHAGANADMSHPLRSAWEFCSAAERAAYESGLMSLAEQEISNDN